MADRSDDVLERISAALDGDGPMPTDLDDEARAFLSSARRLRSLARVQEADVPPDVTQAVLAEVHAGPPPARSPRVSLAAVAVFVAAALVTAFAVGPSGPFDSSPALADVGDRVLHAQEQVLALDAVVRLSERGTHPDVPERSYEGTLRYQAPERLWLHLDDRTPLPSGWRPNDLDLVVDGATAWSRGLLDCPVGEQPGCLRERTYAVTDLPPFSPEVVAPLDLVVPVGAFLPAASVTASADGDSVVVDTTVARLDHTISGLRAAGALRSVHATDPVRLELDAVTFTIRRLTVRAGATEARRAWAASNGYTEASGTPVLDLTVDPAPLPGSPFPAPPEVADRRGGFSDGPAEGPSPSWLPPGYSAHRSGVQADHGPRVSVQSWTNGRAWIRLDVTTEHTGDVLFGGLGPIVRQVRAGGGTAYTDPEGTVVSIRADGMNLAVTGSVPLDDLVRVAASIPVTGEPMPVGWPQGEVLDELPAGALRPAGALVARYDGADLLVAVPGPGQTSAVLRQRPGGALGLPAKADIVEVRVRGEIGRYEPRPQVVTWVEDGWIRELRSDGLDLDALLRLAEDLE